MSAMPKTKLVRWADGLGSIHGKPAPDSPHKVCFTSTFVATADILAARGRKKGLRLSNRIVQQTRAMADDIVALRQRSQSAQSVLARQPG